MKILAIETSCDDTGIAIIEASKKFGFKVLSNIVSSQVEIHKKWGGVYPTLAKREHQKNLVPVLERALKKAKMLKELRVKKINNKESKVKKLKQILKREEQLYKKLEKFLKKYQKPNVDLIAVTIGPGLEPCLWVGINFAKALSYRWKIPIVPINHIEAHILVNWLKPIHQYQIFPAISLVVSGGHTQLILMKDIGNYKILGETRDDAAGECFDKCAKILGLGYPGGPVISQLAVKQQSGSKKINKANSNLSPIHLPRPMINSKDYDFSFSGLKTAVLYYHQKQPKKTQKSKSYIQEMAYQIQEAIIDVLIKKTIKAVKDYKAKSILLAGGVSANSELRSRFESRIKDKKLKINFLAPPRNLSTDNAVMTAIAGFFNQKEKIENDKIITLEAKANLRISKN